MLQKLEYTCLVASIALVGADRIDFLAGTASFKLTPFLLFALLAVSFRILNVSLGGDPSFSVTPSIRRQGAFCVALALFLFLTLFSTVFGMDPQRGLVAFADLLLVSALGYYVSTRILLDPARGVLILRSVTFGLLAYIIFCIAQGILWNRGILMGPGNEGSWVESTFAASNIFWIPRFSGTTIDANRSGLILIMYLALLDWFAPRSTYTRVLRFVIGILVLLAVSRSAIICGLVYLLSSASFWGLFRSVRTVFWAGALALGCLSIVLVYSRPFGDLLDAWQISNVISDRISAQEGTSGGEHLELIERGFDTWSTSAHTIFMGIGLASAPKVLHDFFGDEKTGNFHCLYATALAELGMPAFVVLLILMTYPMIGRTATTSALAAVMIFNFPYQSHMEPVFWLVLAIAWSRQPATGSRMRSLDVGVPRRCTLADS